MVAQICPTGTWRPDRIAPKGSRPPFGRRCGRLDPVRQMGRLGAPPGCIPALHPSMGAVTGPEARTLLRQAVGDSSGPRRGDGVAEPEERRSVRPEGPLGRRLQSLRRSPDECCYRPAAHTGTRASRDNFEVRSDMAWPALPATPMSDLAVGWPRAGTRQAGHRGVWGGPPRSCP